MDGQDRSVVATVLMSGLSGLKECGDYNDKLVL
jgi:hypothetical protein